MTDPTTYDRERFVALLSSSEREAYRGEFTALLNRARAGLLSKEQ